MDNLIPIIPYITKNNVNTNGDVSFL